MRQKDVEGQPHKLAKHVTQSRGTARWLTHGTAPANRQRDPGHQPRCTKMKVPLTRSGITVGHLGKVTRLPMGTLGSLGRSATSALYVSF